jgi:hypothetical protein
MSRFCIVLAEQPHHQVFAEVVESLSWGLRELAHEVEVATMPRAGVRNIVLAPHLLLACGESIHLEPGTIVYNGEPHCSPQFVRSLRLLGLRHVEVWDYSRRTTEFLLGLGIPARTVPYAWCPTLRRRAVFDARYFGAVGDGITDDTQAIAAAAAAAARDVDVLFLGSNSPRRNRVLAELAAVPNLHARLLFGMYGAERDHWLARSKVCLNVHYWDEGGSEDLRVLLACAHSVAVVSEGPPDEPYKSEWARWTRYEDLVDECVHQVRSGDWRRQAARGFAAVHMHDAVTVLREALR